ncbi:MAG: secondary thiamine-phosphate synthase enzyme YjbQ [Planctomycetota bacterium]|nr:secondary thiamine-phosphate synthase enzyme YjbQ [Planctomycetota bacterium]
MTVRTETLELSTRGNSAIHDLTATVAATVRGSGLSDGIVTVFCPGSTGGVTTIEFEPGLVDDMQVALERLVPRDLRYRHNELNHDDNGHSHVRAGLVGPSLTVPFQHGRLTLGTWQQIVFLDFDSGPRQRRLVVQVMGE